MYRRKCRHTEGEGGGLTCLLERGNLAGSSGGTRNSHKKCVNFDQFMAILVFKNFSGLKKIY